MSGYTTFVNGNAADVNHADQSKGYYENGEIAFIHPFYYMEKVMIEVFKFTMGIGEIIWNIKPCPRCKEMPNKEGHDHCIQNLPDVEFACCGHGIQRPYIKMNNGMCIYGFYHVEVK